MGHILRPDGRPYTTDKLPSRITGNNDPHPTWGSGQEALASFTIPELPAVVREAYGGDGPEAAPFVKAVAQAVQYVISDPRTRPLALFPSLLNDLFREAMLTWITMNKEMGYSKKKCCDILPRQFHLAKLKGQKPDQHADEHAKGNMWGKDGTEREEDIELESAANRPEPEYDPEDLDPEMQEAEQVVQRSYSSGKPEE